MKQTIMRDGVIERLPKLIGDNTTFPAPATEFSLQSSVEENFKRVCSSLLGNSSIGRVMAGLGVSANASSVTIEPGYGITKSGDLIKLVSQWTGTGLLGAAAGAVLRVYLKYVPCLRGDSAGTVDGTPYASGGHTSYINRENTSKPIIVDGVGSRSSDRAELSASDIASAFSIVAVESGAVAVTDDRLYLGTLTYPSGVDPDLDAPVFTPTTVGNEYIEYTMTHKFSAVLWNTSDASALNTAYTTVMDKVSRLPLPLGRKRLRQVNVIRLCPSTSSSPRSADYLINLTPKFNGGLDFGAGSMALQDDSLSSYFYQTYEFNAIIPDTAFSINLMATVATTATMLTNTDVNTNGVVLVEYVIEKLN